MCSSDLVSEINAAVLGSSALMGITEKLLPWKTYNLTSTGNGTSAIAAEAAYLERIHGQQINTLLIGLDWSVGMIYAPGLVGEIDLRPDAYTRAYNTGAVAWHKRIEDALSWPRVATLGQLISAAFKSGAPLDNLRHALLDIGGAPYTCADGSIAATSRVTSFDPTIGALHLEPSLPVSHVQGLNYELTSSDPAKAFNPFNYTFKLVPQASTTNPYLLMVDKPYNNPAALTASLYDNFIREGRTELASWDLKFKIGRAHV